MLTSLSSQLVQDFGPWHSTVHIPTSTAQLNLLPGTPTGQPACLDNPSPRLPSNCSTWGHVYTEKEPSKPASGH